MGLVDLDNFIASFITAMKEYNPRAMSIPACVKRALYKQGLEYKDGEIIKTQRRISAEAKETGYGESEDERIRKLIISGMNALKKQGKETFASVPINDCINWLEKQGQKPFDYENATIVQKESPRIESKFKVGDWCIDNEDGTIFQIVKVLDNTYTYKTNEGKEYSCTHYSLENNSRLWTIQDVKDGDVLAEDIIESHPSPFVAICKKQYGELFETYCFIGHDGKFYKGEIGHNGEYVHPATKEQRDTLMKAMADAGWEFDFEKKELKGIKKSTDIGHEYFSDLLEKDDCDNIDDYAYQCAYCMSHDWLKDTATWDDVEKACKLGAKWNERHCKPAWGEEDETGWTNTMIMIKEVASNHYTKGSIKLVVDWLESIKERIGG